MTKRGYAAAVLTGVLVGMGAVGANAATPADTSALREAVAGRGSACPPGRVPVVRRFERRHAGGEHAGVSALG